MSIGILTKDSTKRAQCPRCLRPQSACICHCATTLTVNTEVLILQHPLEVNNPKGSARLLHLSLPNSRLVAGETFTQDTLHTLLYAPWHDGADEGANLAIRMPLLLYPASPEQVQTSKQPEKLEQDLLLTTDRVRLVVLDATWRKSRKMLFLNPALRTLPRLSLSDVPASRYVIRKAHLPHQLSTLEATCLALEKCEGNARHVMPLLHAFDGFIRQQLAYRPVD